MGRLAVFSDNKAKVRAILAVVSACKVQALMREQQSDIFMQLEQGCGSPYAATEWHSLALNSLRWSIMEEQPQSPLDGHCMA